MAVREALREAVLPLRQRFYQWTGQADLAEQVRQERTENAWLRESVSDLENRMFEPGWRRLTALAEQEFTRDGLRQITSVARVMTLKSPLLKRGLALRTAYVWGQGVSITGRDKRVNEVIQRFLDDPGNRRALSSGQAHESLERCLFTDGQVFLALFTAPRTGRVQVRRLPWDEIVDVITNPDDASEPWYYQQDGWTERLDAATGAVIIERRIVFYPALGYRPASRPKVLRGRDGSTGPVRWDAPVYHVRVGGHDGWKFGLADCYAAIDWAQAYKDFLTDWARLVKALSRFAWRLTTKGSKQQAARARIAAAPTRDPVNGDAQHAGATAIMTADMALEAVPKTGATIDSESGRPLAAMTAAALDVPVTMLLGDPGTTGARATAETLDTPTERSMELRQGVWADAFQAILGHVITESVRAPEGILKGVIDTDPYDGRETVRLRGSADTTVDISFPDIDDVDPSTLIEAIVKADSTSHVPPEVITRLLLEALGVRDVDGILAKLTDADGNFISPAASAGQAAADAFRRGEDPASVLGNAPPAAPTQGTGEGPDEGAGGDQVREAAGGIRGIVAGREDVYRELRRQGHSKEAAARIANAGKTHERRSRMAKKAAMTRKARGGS
ncbi:hypothetical protein GCM10009530_63710 [Microbispora corallina]|uniref:Phage portal protein n=1 Tax=Microbispora corallina TaxID=83302 RepID=A0ABQ4GBY3_9ACTN|nr:hypothetical protein [Microbispora corallina]GIH44594.1 hypothetical protein Mco01_75940 [Microbispora corallina]